jgi:outer membrane protein OmpA-like peptidoglycan-associated protein
LCIVGLSLALMTVCVAVVAANQAHNARRQLVLTGTGLEPGWWTKVSVNPFTPAQPASPPVIVASIPSDILFGEGSSGLEDSASKALVTLADAVNQTTGPVEVDGHTDLIGSDESNMRLGGARAQAVARRLIELGVTADRITTRSLGETRPVCDEVNADGSDNADCRARCRRVVVTYSAVAKP